MMMLYGFVRRLLFSLPPERAHTLTLKAVNYWHRVGFSLGEANRFIKPVKCMGLEFTNPIGLAAGLDKNGDYLDALASLGFGFIEIGTVTPQPQPGNDSPRLFRIPQAHAIINRMGFNNKGVDHLVTQVQRSKYQGVLGINVGKNVNTPIEQAVDDYLICLRKVYSLASYITINISSPNTKNLRQLQNGEELGIFLQKLKQAQVRLDNQYHRYVPLVVKIAPDLSTDDIAEMAHLFIRYEIDGVIATNTTISREQVEHYPNGNQAGGLSGSPLTKKSTAVVSTLQQVLGDKIPIIASGGVMNGHDVKEKYQAGASLVQLYSGLIYAGPRLVSEAVQAV